MHQQTLQGTNKVWETDVDGNGFMIFMGINQLSEIRDYWSIDPNFRYALIAYRITCDRFEEITRNLHFVDNDLLPSKVKKATLGYRRWTQ